MMRDSFIDGLLSNDIHRRLLEEKQLTFDRAFELAVTYSDARADAQQFEIPVHSSSAEPVQVVTGHVKQDSSDSEEVLAFSSTYSVGNCGFCGSRRRHDFKNCRAQYDTCNSCGKKGHWVLNIPMSML